MQRRTVLTAAALGALSAATHVQPAEPAVPPEVAAALPAARLQGSGRMRFFGMHIYDARLWVGEQPLQSDWPGLLNQPLALEVAYARRLDGRQIAERSLTEMRRQGEMPQEVAARWLQRMVELIPDVGAGDRLTAVNLPGRGMRLLANGVSRGEVDEAEFAQRFLGIWLAPQTSEPQLRLALLGRAAS